MTHRPNQPNEQLKAAARSAVEREDALAVGRIAEVLRLRHRLNYDESVAFFVTAGATPDGIEGLFYESDELEGNS